MKLLDTLKRNKKGLLLITGGIGAAAAGAVMVNKASLKCTEIMEEHAQVKRVIEECAAKCIEEYSEEDMARDVIIANTQTTIKLIKLYSLPYATILAGGIMIINGSCNIIKMRKVGIVNEHVC